MSRLAKLGLALGSVLSAAAITLMVECVVLVTIVDSQARAAEEKFGPSAHEGFTGTHTDLLAWVVAILIIVFPLAVALCGFAIWSLMTSKQGRELKILSALILMIGLGVATAIYVSAPWEENLALYEIGISKQYNRTLQQFGGKASVLFDEIQTWFAARWQGKQLGVTIGWLSVGAALALYLVARRGK